MRAASKLEVRLEQQLQEAGFVPASVAGPGGYLRNYFFLRDRDFELDFAWPADKVAIEVQGMAHRIKGKFKADIEKRALALLCGWKVLEVDGDAIRSGKAMVWAKQLLVVSNA